MKFINRLKGLLKKEKLKKKAGKLKSGNSCISLSVETCTLRPLKWQQCHSWYVFFDSICMDDCIHCSKCFCTNIRKRYFKITYIIDISRTSHIRIITPVVGLWGWFSFPKKFKQSLGGVGIKSPILGDWANGFLLNPGCQDQSVKHRKHLSIRQYQLYCDFQCVK